MNDDEHGYLWDKRFQVLYRAQLSARYHQKRERFYELLDKLVKAVAIFGGSAALSKALPPDALVFVVAAITATSTLSLVFGFSDKAKKHAEIARSYCHLESGIVGAGERDFQEADLKQWEAKLCALGGTEPPALGALVVACQNELAVGAGEFSKVVALPLYKRLTKDFIDWRVECATR